MKSIKWTIIFGFLLWLIPFIVAFAIYPIRETNYPFFETIMPVTLTLCVVIFAVLYMKDLESGYIAEGVKIGIVWFLMSVVIDLFMFTWGPMKMSFGNYMMDIGLTYLIFPVVTIGFGLSLQKK
ncbi:MAG: hypothetical protein V3W18_13860 [candidate division Zixibacteria bacterium]